MTLVWMDCDARTTKTYIRRRGAARDNAKLADWPAYVEGIDTEFRPAVPHVVIDNCTFRRALQAPGQAAPQRHHRPVTTPPVHGMILYGPPAAGKDTITAALRQLDPRYVLFQRIKAGPGRSTGYRMADADALDALRAAGDVIYEHQRYGATYVIDRPIAQSSSAGPHPRRSRRPARGRQGHHPRHARRPMDRRRTVLPAPRRRAAPTSPGDRGGPRAPTRVGRHTPARHRNPCHRHQRAHTRRRFAPHSRACRRWAVGMK